MSRPNLTAHDVVALPKSLDPPDFANWAETTFGLLLDKEAPTRVVYKLSAGLQKNIQVFRIYFGLAILNLVAHKKRISIEHVSPTVVRPKAFGLPNSMTIDQHVQALFGDRATPWNAGVREAVAYGMLRL